MAVPGLVPDDIFFAMLAERVFPVGNFIRPRDQLDYLEAPDCFHDMFGHIPMLAHHDFAEMARACRRGSAWPPCAAGEGERAARHLLAHASSSAWRARAGELKILGAGLASSFGEAHFSLESGKVERLPFSDRAGGAHALPARRLPAALPGFGLRSTRTVADVLSLTAEELLARLSLGPARRPPEPEPDDDESADGRNREQDTSCCRQANRPAARASRTPRAEPRTGSHAP